MQLSFKELKKRDVINVADGRNLGSITDLSLVFPSGMFTGITVPGKKVNWFLRLFQKSEMFIERSKIQRIGNDVILVNLKCGDFCADSVPANNKKPSGCPSIFPCSNNNSESQNINNIDLDDY
ncbi:MAG: YlmC/YmxH family sporulation protein [Firmicutes bacterium]|nr:YlmC/YmxH family sporulation protein [Candidatus Caballimonas caccae]